MSALGDGAPPVVWRTKLRSTVPGVDHAQQVEHCLKHGVIGMGWRMDDVTADTPLESVVARIESPTDPGWGRPAAQTVRRLGAEPHPGDFVWTRDTSGRYLLCRITGPYRYDGSKRRECGRRPPSASRRVGTTPPE